VTTGEPSKQLVYLFHNLVEMLDGKANSSYRNKQGSAKLARPESVRVQDFAHTFVLSLDRPPSVPKVLVYEGPWGEQDEILRFLPPNVA
jgi:hypothetical protein